VRNLTASGFEAALYEQESLNNGHPEETVGYLAIHSPTSSGSASFFDASFNYQLNQSSLKQQGATVGGQLIKLQEEQSNDTETAHAYETVDILQLEGHTFAQAVSFAGADPFALRRVGDASSVEVGGTPEAALAYLHTDHLGAVVKATDEQGGLVWDGERRPFGERVVAVSDVEMVLGFPGQYYDQETGNYYNYFRDYDPATGRYLQSDPIGLNGSINTFAYVKGNPIILLDPYGLQGIRGNGSSNQGNWRPPNSGDTRYGVFGCVGGCASYTQGDSEAQASMSPTLGGGVMFCSPKPEKESICENEDNDAPPKDCGMYDPNCDNNIQPSVSVTRLGLGFGAVVNDDGSACILLGPFASYPIISPSYNLGGIYE
jgi:RHS repeat-associated protein